MTWQGILPWFTIAIIASLLIIKALKSENIAARFCIFIAASVTSVLIEYTVHKFVPEESFFNWLIIDTMPPPGPNVTPEEAIKRQYDNLLQAYVGAYNDDDPSIIEDYMRPGMYRTMSDYILVYKPDHLSDSSLVLESSSILRYSFSDTTHCTIYTNEDFYVHRTQNKSYPINQKVHYKVQFESGIWMFTAISVDRTS